MCTNRVNRVGHVKRRRHWGFPRSPKGITITCGASDQMDGPRIDRGGPQGEPPEVEGCSQEIYTLQCGYGVHMGLL